MHKLRLPALIVLVLVMSSALAVAEKNPCNPCSKGQLTFHVADPMGRNTVTFKSEAPLEDIVGTTNKITGHLVFDPMDPAKGGHGQLTVSTAGFNTGIPMRDEHLVSADWLDASQFPDITLRISEVKGVKKVKEGNGSATFDVQVVGDLTFHGRTGRVEFPARITYLKESKQTQAKMQGDLLAARGEFEITLADFGVTGPKGKGLIGSKVGKTIEIEVSLMGSTAGGDMAKNPCNPCGGQAKNPCNPCNPCGK